MNGIITSGSTFTLNFLLSIISGVQLLDSTSYNSEMYSQFERDNFSRSFLCFVSLFILSCFADDAVDAGLKRSENKENLIDNIDIQPTRDGEPPISSKQYSSFLSKITFYWYTKFVKVSAKREIELNDIWELEDHLKIDNVSKEFEIQYFKELQKIKDHNRTSAKKAKLNSWRSLKIIIKVYGFQFLSISFVKFIFDMLNFVSPLLLSAMINYTKDKHSARWQGYLIVIGFLVSSFLKNILINNYFEKAVGLGLKFKSSITNLIFSKALKISPQAKKNRTTGESM